MLSKIRFQDYRNADKEYEDGAPTDPNIRREHPLKDAEVSPLEDRKNFRIARCCLTCRYHTTNGPNPARMACIFPYKTVFQKKKAMGWPEDRKLDKEFLLQLQPTHAGCVCAAHAYKVNIAGMVSLDNITRYCGAEVTQDVD